MPISYTAEELKAKHREDFPEPLGELYHELSRRLTHLNLCWRTFRTLFANVEEVERLNYWAPSFLALMDEIMRNEIQLALCRLTDPAASVGKANLSVWQMVEGLRRQGESSLASRVEALMSGLEPTLESLRHQRNKRLAHTDLAGAIEPAAVFRGTSVTYGELGHAIHTLNAVFNDIEKRFLGSTTIYTEVVEGGGADQLLVAIKYADRWREEERRRLLRE